MAKIIDSYEELLSYTEEVRDSLDIIHKWLQSKPNVDEYWSYHDLITLHGQHFALLNLIMHRMDSLISEHRAIVNDTIRKGE
ncbi:hypothetical protein [Streptococcus sp. S784/96/1]|uniref:hypothetical protein n=1 Tax=Streptococcus sp. S784/96/1 TaxID=2653499 RepID=UPI001389BCA1|nr:hypothetical protein [Streptococcus sp. S784/96/1]